MKMDKEENRVIRLNTTLNMGHLIFSSISMLIVIITLWVNVNVRLAELEFEVKAQKEKDFEIKQTQDKLILEITRTSSEMTKLLYEIKLELKDKQDKLGANDGN